MSSLNKVFKFSRNPPVTHPYFRKSVTHSLLTPHLPSAILMSATKIEIDSISSLIYLYSIHSNIYFSFNWNINSCSYVQLPIWTPQTILNQKWLTWQTSNSFYQLFLKSIISSPAYISFFISLPIFKTTYFYFHMVLLQLTNILEHALDTSFKLVRWSWSEK